MTLSQACDRDVEVLGARTEWNTLYAQPDGQMRLESSIEAVRSGVSGDWTAIDTSLASTNDGIEMAAPAVEMVFSDGRDDQPLVRMMRDGHELTFDVPFDLPEPVLYGSTLEYAQVAPGVDLVVTVNDDGSGFSEVLRVDSPEAAADLQLTDLTFPVAVSDGLTLTESGGGLVATDAAGERVFGSPAPAMWDSRSDPVTPALAPRMLGFGDQAAVTAGEEIVQNRVARATAPLDDDKHAVMSAELSGDALVARPDADMLTDPATVWPIYIDPSFDGSQSYRVSVRNDGWTDHNYTGDQGVGLCGTTGSPMYCSKVFTRRAAWQFAGLDAIKDVAPADISAATLRAFGTHSYSCTAYPVEAWWTGGISASTTWSNLSWLAGLDTQVVAHKDACSNARDIEFNVLGGAQQTAAQHATQLTVGLKAANESSSTGWKRYRYDARLSITYNRAPNTPSSPYMTNTLTGGSLGCGTTVAPTYVSTATPLMWATLSDPDPASSVAAWFDVYRDGQLVWDGGQTAYQTTGQKHYRQVPAGYLVEGPVYAWNVFAYDGARQSGAGVACAFVVDQTRPVVPTLAPLTGQPGVYYEEQVGGGAGLKGKFTASGSADVVSFWYAFDDGTPTSIAASGGSAVVPYDNPTVGPHQLKVWSTDRAGNSGDSRVYRFVVAVAGKAAQWMLDDPRTGTSAADSGPNGLTLAASTAQWIDGPLAEAGLDPTDGARRFVGNLAEAGHTNGPVVATDHPFSVAATVRLDSTGAPATAVSQDGTTRSGFELGYLGDGLCAESGNCWGFWMLRPDSDPGDPYVFVGSEVPVEPGSWVQLTGVFDGAAMQLHVCQLGGEPVSSSSEPFVPGWQAQGALQVGRGQFAGASTHPWRGDIADVRVYDGVVDIGQVRANCNPG